MIDAAYGTGFHGEHHAPDVDGAPVLAVDIPSGVDGLTGEARGRALRRHAHGDLRARSSRASLLEPGRSLAGRVVVADIGLDVGAARRRPSSRPPTCAAWLPARATATPQVAGRACSWWPARRA